VHLSEQNHIGHLCNKIPKVAPPYGNVSFAFVVFEKGLHKQSEAGQGDSGAWGKLP
jgi:hypothetical protein